MTQGLVDFVDDSNSEGTELIQFDGMRLKAGGV